MAVSASKIDVPSWQKFQAAAAQSDYVGLASTIEFDHETAISLADRYVDRDHFFLLESATSGPGQVARFTFMGFDPLWDSRCEQSSAEQNPLAHLRSRLQGKTVQVIQASGVRQRGPDLAPFVGACGFFGYDMAMALEPTVGKPLPKRLGLPDALFFLPEKMLVLDQLTRKLSLIVTADLTQGSSSPTGLRGEYDRGIRTLVALGESLLQPHVPPPLKLGQEKVEPEMCESAVTKEQFLKNVEAMLEQVRAGEIFQVQIGNRLSCQCSARPFDVFRHLRILNPSPYMFFYKFGKDHILGSSPEMMVSVQNHRVVHRPIAGTRRRYWNAEKDHKMRAELTGSEKERAEHVMLVDLARNDVGRVAKGGSVQVEELMTVEEYSHVFHMVSQVAGTLADGEDVFSALASGFPNGTVAGAPKIRAMQLINETETFSREFYAGSLGFFNFQGDLKSTILIRTIHMAEGIASTQASAGIVYDSLPEEEWLETRNKMRACLEAMINTG